MKEMGRIASFFLEQEEVKKEESANPTSGTEDSTASTSESQPEQPKGEWTQSRDELWRHPLARIRRFVNTRFNNRKGCI